MKKLLLSMIMVFSVITLMAQIERKQVVLEIGTGTWCTYCPGAAMGADDLLENGCDVAVIENHNGDTYANTYSNARNTYYGINSFPTAVFDGVMKYVGGSHSSSLYSTYLPRYNSRKAIPSNFDMSMEVTNNGLDYTAVITITKVAASTATQLVLQFCVTQSNIEQNWQGQTHLEHVNRLMVPNQNGTPVDFTSGDVQTVTLTYSLDPAWPVEDCEFIAFLQSNNGKEIQQGIKRGAIDLTPGFEADATQVPYGGTVHFTNTTVGGYIGVPETYSWFFEGGTPATSTDKEPTVVYNECGSHAVTYIVNRGNQIDTIVREAYINVGPTVNIVTTPGDTACMNQSITLDGTTQGATSYTWLPGGFTTPTITVDTTGLGLGLHTFTLVVSTADCNVTRHHDIFFDNCLGTSKDAETNSLSIFPNPNNGTFTLETTKSMTAGIKVINTIGLTLFNESDVTLGKGLSKTVSLKNAPAGGYYVIIENGDQKLTKKMIVR